MTYSAVLAGAAIEEDEHVRIELQGDKTVAYPVDSEHERLLLPIATEDANRGEIVTVRS